MANGKLLVISGPSGVGKSTVIRKAMWLCPELSFSVSVTTRPQRPEEREGIHYYFRTPEQFQKMVEEDAFYEHASYTGNSYGTPRAPVDRSLQAGKDVIMDIDVQGALQIRERCPDAVLIFLAAPSWEELSKRLRTRGDTSETDIQKRLLQAKWEYSRAPEYDYIVKSDVPEKAAAAVLSILCAERCRAARMQDLLSVVEGDEL